MKSNTFIIKSIGAALGLSVVIAGVLITSGSKTAADTKVLINETNFPCERFRNYMLEHFDSQLPYGELDEDEISLVTDLYFAYDNTLTDLKGIEFLPELKSITVMECGLTSIDVSKNLNLTSLNCDNNSISSLNVRANTELTFLSCSSNKLKSLDLSNNQKLEILNVSRNQLSSIDTRKNTNLTRFDCENNTEIKSVSFANNSKLKHVACSGCSISSLNLDNLTDLELLSAGQNPITSLDVNKHTKLSYLYCSDCKITSIDVSKLSQLKDFHCGGNKLTKLNISGNPLLETLYCECNSLTSLDLSKNTALKLLDCRFNKLKGLNLKKCSVLEHLDCNNNELSFLELPTSEVLNILTCNGNQLAKLNISPCKALIDMYKNGERLDYEDDFYIYGEYPAEFKCDQKVKIITDAKVEPTDTPTPTPVPDLDIVDNESSIAIAAGETVRLDSSVLGAKPYTWTSSNTKIATVSSTGIVTGRSAGTVTITVSKGSKKLTCQVTVVGSIAPTATVTPTSKPVLTSKPTLTPKPVVTSNPKDIATPSPTQIPKNVKLSSETVVCGKTVTVDASVIGTAPYNWSVSNTKVATVDPSGKVSAKMAGTVTVTATKGNKKLICTVTVLYKDVTKTKDFWYAPTNYLTAKDVVKGYDKQTKFKPKNKCTRAQMVTFIWRLQGEPEPKSKTCKFSDVKAKDYFYKACIWGNENHIVEGYKNGTFGPQIVCARKHAVTFLWRLANKPSPKSKVNKFKDVKPKDYFYTATLWASEQGILAGYKDGTFKPNGDCLRRQMVTFLYKYDKYVNGKG